MYLNEKSNKRNNSRNMTKYHPTGHGGNATRGRRRKINERNDKVDRKREK
jgi:hypothetical protein